MSVNNVLKNAFIMLCIPPCGLFMSAPLFAADELGGERLYQDFGCILCHGITGHRGASGGRPLAPLELPFDTFQQLVRFPANNMPAFSDEDLTDGQLRSIFDYLAAVEPPPLVEEIDALRELREQLYAD